MCDAALERDAPARASFVAAACGGDEALRQEVDALLAHAQAAEHFLVTPVGDVAAQILVDDHEPSLIGRQIGSYKILAFLGAGGMGEVYRAHDAKLGRDVAVKVVADAFLSIPERLARFEREAQVLATLNHPHIGAIYGLEEADGVRGLVLELVEGATLAESLRLRGLTMQEALTVAQQIADALEFAHEKGIIHRDLKPANIKITPDGIVKVLDFGLAKVFAREEPPPDPVQIAPITVDGTVDGVIAGTAGYMSPEQARGKTVDKRTDIWAFGCVVYQILTAQSAFRGETVSDTIGAILEREPDWSVLPAQTPANIRRLLQRCLEKDPKRRLRDIGDARLEIEETLAARPSSREALDSGRAGMDHPKPRARLARLAWWAAAGAGLLAIGAAAAWSLKRPEILRQLDNLVWRNPLEGATVTRLTDFKGAEQHAAISRDGKFVAFLWDGDGTWDAWGTQVGTGKFVNLTNGSVVGELRNPDTRTVAFFPDGLRVWLWSRVGNADGGGQVDSGLAVSTMGGPLPAPFKGRGISELDWSSDGRMVSHPPTSGDPLSVTEPDQEVGREILAARAGVHNHFPVWSRDGAFIYFVRAEGKELDEGDVWRIRHTGGDPERLTFHNSRVTFPTLLDNRTLLYLATGEDGSGPWIYAVDVERRVPHRIFAGPDPYTSLSTSADGRRLVATASRKTIRLWRAPISDVVIDAAHATPIAIQTANDQSPRRGPGYVVYRGPKTGTHNQSLWKLADGREAGELWNGFDGRVVAGAAIAPDGQRLAFPVQRWGQRQLYVMNADGTGARPIAHELDVRGAPAWSPDGRWVAIAANLNGEPKLFKIPVDGGKPSQLVHEYSTDPIWAPSGRFLVYTGADVGTNLYVKAVSADGTPNDLREIRLTRGARRLAFLGGDDALVILKGDISHKEFWVVDLKTGRERQLTRLGREFVIGDFDISPDGREIIFDRSREESDVILIDRTNR